MSALGKQRGGSGRQATQRIGSSWGLVIMVAIVVDLPQEGRDRIREIVSGQDCVLASPFPNLDAPVVASAWGKQLRLEGADDPDLERFVRAYQRGPQTPEPGAACTGGVGDPA
jgi:hypothetical protein